MKIQHQFVRTIFYLALLCAAMSVLLVTFMLFTETTLAHWIDGLIAQLILSSFGGLFASVILANFVHCPACGKKAMIFPDSPDVNTNPDNVHQPWRTCCGHCNKKLSE